AVPTGQPGEPSGAVPTGQPGEPSGAVPTGQPGEPSGAVPTGQPTVLLGPVAPPPRPSRRKLLLGLAGGAVAAAGGGTALLVTRTSDRAKQPRSAPGPQAATPVADPTDYTRSLETDMEATPLWTAPLAEPLIKVAGDGDTIVLAGMKSVWALDRAGQPRWGPLTSYSAPAGVGSGDCPVAVGGGMAYVMGFAGPSDLKYVFNAVDLATGAVAWTLTRPDLRISRSASVVGLLDNIVYVHGEAWGSFPLSDPKTPTAATASFVWAVDTATHQVRWQALHPLQPLDSTRLAVPSSGTRLLWETYSLDLNTYKKAGKLEALDVNNGGKSLWQQLAPGSGTLQTRLSVFNDGPHSSAAGYFLYLADRLYAVNPADGKVVWQSQGEWGVQAAVASPDDTTVYTLGTHYAERRTVVQAFDAKTGTVRWSGSLPMGLFQDTAVQYADGTLYVWIHGKVWALDPATGAPRWTFGFHPGGGSSTPVPYWAGGGRLYGPTDKGLAAIAADGRTAHS
ncbi:PQQ-binding-like beta-propeller repeat protein, partial [Kitasatospora sp. NPDC050543]|uniref:outer membrane protein assembly factor BamB family protein n=1 Tax=Kitasatospora sp. NPDC050543 TaxID=3364054 RepID=UPI0037BA7523